MYTFVVQINGISEKRHVLRHVDRGGMRTCLLFMLFSRFCVNEKHYVFLKQEPFYELNTFQIDR